MVSRVIRPTWTPQTAEHRRLVAEAVEAAKRWRQAEDKVWAAFEAARQGGVALTYLTDLTEIPRATLYRHLPKDEEG